MFSILWEGGNHCLVTDRVTEFRLNCWRQMENFKQSRRQVRPNSEKISKMSGKRGGKWGKNRGKEEKLGKEEKIGKKRKNREEKAKIGKVLSLCPSWQRGLTMPLHIWNYLGGGNWGTTNYFGGKDASRVPYIQSSSHLLEVNWFLSRGSKISSQ